MAHYSLHKNSLEKASVVTRVNEILNHNELNIKHQVSPISHEVIFWEHAGNSSFGNVKSKTILFVYLIASHSSCIIESSRLHILENYINQKQRNQEFYCGDHKND